jgi:single-strand DNA-binding protein
MRYTQSGTAVTHLRLATDRSSKNAEGETDWHTVVYWGKLAEAVNSYVQKGDRLYVAGRLLYRTYEDGQGQRRHQAEINAQEVVFLEPRPEAAEAKGEEVAQDNELPF